ncbi:unnamed protein product [Medioppia subpectinata]|uniref:Uncharacterized protein n=1 Tax=Medioppia subpectinata TaxID=1979941 RepID=A0A7R9KYC4_9ACAR|nr:unnamed protein product [Medioppia subpectinata]CAG2110831.1 unnamed protein product [Medioppia subpectinata]
MFFVLTDDHWHPTDTPICRNSALKSTVAMTVNETQVLRCSVEAQPLDVSFYWTFNNYELHSDNYTARGLTSELRFRTASAQDFGLVSCWAKNEVGLQAQPCLFHITTALPPQPPRDCSVANRTMTSLTIECTPGDSAGLSQTFFAQHFGADSGVESDVKNLSASSVPLFFIAGLSSGTEYTVNLYAINAKGMSAPTRMLVSTLSTVNTKLVSGNQELDYDPILAVIVGALLSLILIVLIVIIICKIKQQDEEKDKREQQTQQNTIIGQLSDEYSIVQQTSQDELSHKNPDVIPCDLQSFNDSKTDLFIINDMRDDLTSLSNTSIIETVLQQKPKSILVNGYIPNGTHRKMRQFTLYPNTNGDQREELLYYDQRDAGVIVHQTLRFDDLEGNEVQQTAV